MSNDQKRLQFGLLLINTSKFNQMIETRVELQRFILRSTFNVHNYVLHYHNKLISSST